MTLSHASTIAFVLLPFLPSLSWAADPTGDFDKKVAPILAARCLDCHSGAAAKGKLDLQIKRAAMDGGESGVAIAPGKADESLLWQRIAANEMPPKKPLPERERAIIKAWIEAGAKWGSDPIDPFQFSTSSRAGVDWWSLQPPVRPTTPAAQSNPIDAFISAKLAKSKLSPSPAADRRTLIRRLYFDLLGLPPTPEEIRAFIADASPDAYPTLVKRLLESPHYGERWARHWLDVVHFGESDGFEYDMMRPHAWRYRDWVIDALNRDLPFDQFAKLQIAGDVMKPNDAQALIATGFLVGGAHDGLQPAGDALRQVMRQDELEDIVGIVGQSFLGVTVNCARCHDHKFDPIRQMDYYRLASALSGVRRGDRSVPAPMEIRTLSQKVAELKRQLAEIEEPIRKQILQSRVAGAGDRTAPPTTFASWDFSRDLKDSVGGLHGRANGKAKSGQGGLSLDGIGSFVATAPLTKDLQAKTLEAWVRLSKLDQRGGGVIGIQTLDGGVFDTIVFGERDPGQWLAGSNFFRRTKSFGAPKETEVTDQPTHIAITYGTDGRITGYRSGVPYGKSYSSDGPVTFRQGEAQVVFGLRHSPPGDGKHLAGIIERANLYDRALSPEEIAASAGVPSKFVSDAELTSRLPVEERQRRKQMMSDLATVEAQLARLREAKTFAVTPKQPEPTHLLRRGDTQQKLEVVSAGGLSALPDNDFKLAPDAPEAQRRIKLAEWIASDKNPLFARTIVNRLWHYHFGRGLVDTPNDLGFSGGQPVHRELLDWLATELIRQNWSLKELHRTIVLSATYQQSSAQRAEAMAVDADNRLFWRYAPRRLDAETLRDATLSIAGQLNTNMGGPSFQDFRPFLYRGSQFYEPLDPVGPEFNRRSIYRMGARGGRNQLLDTFDCPDPSTTTPKRGSTTTPLQALSLMNNSFTLRMADTLADRLKRDSGDDVEKQIQRGFALVCGRNAKDAEIRASRELIAKHGLAPFCRAMLNTNGFLYVH